MTDMAPHHALDKVLAENDTMRVALELIATEPGTKDKYGNSHYDAKAYELRIWAREALNRK